SFLLQEIRRFFIRWLQHSTPLLQYKMLIGFCAIYGKCMVGILQVLPKGFLSISALLGRVDLTRPQKKSARRRIFPYAAD
ncbi:hypothetical protein, partial [Acidaminococcus timonensis]|uniref:hypothetical protein n=1 Tax=Acidaminococcus timonensis TaxID=1871002 RepID=UPI00307AC1F5